MDLASTATLYLAAGTFAGPALKFVWEGVLQPAGGNVVGTLFEKWTKPKLDKVVEAFALRMSKDRLPANHDIARASQDALRSALLWMAHHLSGELSSEQRELLAWHFRRGEPAADFVDRIPVDWTHRRWAAALVSAARDEHRLGRLEIPQQPRLRVDVLLRSDVDAVLAADLHERARKWLADELKHCGEPAPDRLEEFFTVGWRMNEEDVKLTLYQAWCWFFRESIKKRPDVFKSFVATALADLLGRDHTITDQQLAATTDAFVQRLQEPLAALLRLAQDTREDVRVIRRAVERAAAFKWPTASPFEVHMSKLLKSFTGRQWLLRAVKRWVASEDPRALLIRADFGVGKSAFMAHLLREFRGAGVPCAVHFCRFDREDDLSPTQVVKSLAAQFRKLVPEYATFVEADDSAQQALSNAKDDPVAAWGRGVLDPLAAISGPPGPSAHLVLLIDGLDETQELHRRTGGPGRSLLDMILQGTAGRLPSWIRVILSSRPVGELDSQGTRFAIFDMGSGRGNAIDLRRHVRSHLHLPRVQAILRSAGLVPADFVKALCELCQGKFLLATYMLRDMQDEGFHADDLLRVLRPGATSGLDLYYADVFKDRISKSGCDRETVRDVLGLVAFARQLMPASALAEVLASRGVMAQDVTRVIDAFGGLLRYTSEGGITFDHLSLKEWLDKSREVGRTSPGQVPKAGDYAIDRDASTRRLQQHCQLLIRLTPEQRRGLTFAPYFEKFGVAHLVDAGDLAHALELLLLRCEIPQPRGAALRLPPPRRMENRFIRGLQDALHHIDRKFTKLDGSAQERAELAERAANATARLAAISADQLKWLLHDPDYETGKYEPVLRTLIQFKRKDWPAIRASLSHQIASDLVLRNDIGVAHAEAWFTSEAAEQDELLQAIERMAEDPGKADEREIAGYALKHICQKSDPHPWWERIEATIRRQVAAYARSASAVDRMVAGEMLLALTLQGVKVLDWLDHLPSPERDRFWQPPWANQQTDIGAILDFASTELGWGGQTPPALLAAQESARVQREYAMTLSVRLLKHPLFQKTADKAGVGAQVDNLPSLNRLQWAAGPSFADQQCDKIALDEALDSMAHLVARNEHRDVVLDTVRRIMLHPLWDLTETGSSLISDLIKHGQWRDGPWWMIDALLDAPPEHWRLLYGAVDAAFNVGGIDKYRKFRDALVVAGHVPHCRVRGICADNLRRWVDHAGPDERDRILNDPEVAEVVARWLREADDCWLLEYVHLLLSELWAGGSRERDLVHALVARAGSLSSHLRATGRPFYELSPEQFLASIEPAQ